MGKHHKFDELIDAPFRWPRPGDTAFVVSSDWSDNAYVPDEMSMRLYSMTAGYRLGADTMVDRALDEPTERDILVCPIIFAYRQFLELSLKSLISNYGPAVGMEAIWNTHRLEQLWAPFVEMLGRYGNNDPDYADADVGNVVAEFAKIDPNSFNHRYPVDAKGVAIPLSLEALDLAWLKDVMNGVAGYFSGCDGYLDALRSSSPSPEFA